jgi:tRNA A37 threonylcarbamoyladenosine dehydratase
MTTERFSRTELLIGKAKLEKLQKSRSCVVGLGAVGSYALEGLVRAGVGEIIVVDFDTIRPSNINRQLLATELTLDRPKVDVAKERALSINPDARVTALKLFVDNKTVQEIISLKPDIVIDAIDSLNPKIQLMTAIYKSGIPLVSSMGAATRTDPSKVRVADLFDTRMCPLAARLRRRLKEEGVGKGIRCVYSEEAQDVHLLSAVGEREEGELTRGRVRRRLGSLSTITGIFGLTAATIALEMLSGGLNRSKEFPSSL